MRLTFIEYLKEQDDSFLNVPATELEDASSQLPNADVDQSVDTDLDSDNPEVGSSSSPDKKGILRKVKWAHLISKRNVDDGSFVELWCYNIGNKDHMRDEIKVRNDILAGTDIPPHSMRSKDGTQYYELWTCGNTQFIRITGLPN